MSMLSIFVFFVFNTANDSVSLSSIGRLLESDDFSDRKILEDCAPVLMQRFELLLKSPSTTAVQLRGIYCSISLAKVDGKRFLGSALLHLLHDDAILRGVCSTFIGKVGTAADSGPLLMILSDRDGLVAHSAADSLGMIGDDRTVVALNIWLLSPRKPDDDPANKFSLSHHVVQSRDQIKARLAAAAKPAPAPPK